jgi:alpha-maltose-1-phosphate synthase
LKVTIVNFYGKGGMLYYATALANAISRRCETRLVLPKKPSGFYSGLNDDVELVQVHVPEDFSRRNLIKLPFYLSAFPLLVRRVLRGAPDIVHFTNENIWLTGLAPIVSRRLVWTLHDPMPHSGDSLRKKLSTRILANLSKKIFVHYQFNFEVAKQAGIDPSKLVVIPHGDYNFYEKYKRSDIKPRRMVLFWGRIRPYKGIETLIESAAFLPGDVEIVIAGEGAGIYEPHVKGESRIKLIDSFLSENEIAGLCQECSVVATPYIDASQSGIVPVAYAFSKPVVATNVGALPEQVDDGVTGLLVPPSQPVKLAEALIQIFDNPEMAGTMGAAGYKKSHTDMAWNEIANKVFLTYENILKIN